MHWFLGVEKSDLRECVKNVIYLNACRIWPAAGIQQRQMCIKVSLYDLSILYCISTDLV